MNPASTRPARALDRAVRETVERALAPFGFVRLAAVFGSMASGRQRPDSDLDIAILADRPLTAEQRIALIDALALSSGRAIDLVDLKAVGQPLLHQIMRHGKIVLGSTEAWASLMYRNLVDRADFVPLQERMLRERRERWIGK